MFSDGKEATSEEGSAEFEFDSNVWLESLESDTEESWDGGGDEDDEGIEVSVGIEIEIDGIGDEIDIVEEDEDEEDEEDEDDEDANKCKSSSPWLCKVSVSSRSSDWELVW